MKKPKLLITTILLTAVMSSIAWAGEWKQLPNNSYDYKEIWTYQKDDGLPAANEWLQIDGRWYWFQADGSLPTAAGYAPDGFCFNAKGEYIDLTDGCSFITRELSRQVQVGMSYNEITSVLGKEHETITSSKKTVGLQTFYYRTLRWYSKDLKQSVTINFTNDVSDDKF